MTPTDQARGSILVWDLPLRVFHWLLAATFAAAFVTAESKQFRELHAVLGYTTIALVAFRLVWGFVGTRYARFGAFPFSPSKAIGYLRDLIGRKPAHYVGHNPAGGIAMYAMLALVLVAGFTGIAVVNKVGGHLLKELHEGVANAMLALVAVHVAAAVLSSIFHGENLVRSMVTGRKRGEPGDAIRSQRPLVAVVLVAIVVGVWTGAVPLPGLESARALTGVTAQADGARHAGRDHGDD
jgi:cytochrome b